MELVFVILNIYLLWSWETLCILQPHILQVFLMWYKSKYRRSNGNNIVKHFCLLYMGWENVTSYESCGLRQKTFDMCVLKLIMLMVETKPIWYIFRPSNEISWHAICRNYEKFNVIIRGYHLIEKLFDINFINIYYLLQQPKQESDIKIGIKLISLLTLICARNITQTISWDKFDLILQWAIDLSLTFVTCTQ